MLVLGPSVELEVFQMHIMNLSPGPLFCKPTCPAPLFFRPAVSRFNLSLASLWVAASFGRADDLERATDTSRAERDGCRVLPPAGDLLVPQRLADLLQLVGGAVAGQEVPHPHRQQRHRWRRL
eukprot:1498591-Prymnesium_polylepis.1